jgi:hypothetical protein
MVTLKPTAGVLGLLEGQKEAGKRVDFRPDDFVLAVETKGYRVAWSRASICPCKPNNIQTDQPDPNCTLCLGTGWLRFKPANPVIDDRITGALDSVQQTIVNDQAAVIRCVMSGITNKREPYDHVLPRLEGTINVTARWENKLGYYDRLVNLDSTVVYAQILEYDGNAATSLRYPARGINLLRSESRIYEPETDYTLNASGQIVWTSGSEPPADERLSAHYICHPTWRVVEHPHALRLTPVKYKTKSGVGDPRPLPVQAVAKLEYML